MALSRRKEFFSAAFAFPLEHWRVRAVWAYRGPWPFVVHTVGMSQPERREVMILKARDVLSNGAFAIAKNGGGDPENTLVTYLRAYTFDFLSDGPRAAFTSRGDACLALGITREEFDRRIYRGELKCVPITTTLAQAHCVLFECMQEER